MSLPRVIILKQYFDPEPTMKGLLFAQKIASHGWDVEVVTGFPNYPRGKVYPGHKIRPIKREIMGGIPVTRLALFPSHSSSKFGRVLNYVSFFLSSFIYLSFFARKADIIYAYTPPLTVGLAAMSAQLFRRMPVVIDIQDLWPDTLKATGMVKSDRILKVVGHLCEWTYKRATKIAVLSPGFKRALAERGVDVCKISVIPNWADESAVTASTKGTPRHFNNSDRFRVLFAGNMGKAQSLETVLDAAAILSTKDATISFYFLGSGLELDLLKTRAKENGLSNVYFIPRVPMADVGAYLSASDCLLVHLRDDPLFTITIPSKTQAYMASGKPIIMGVPGDAADIVERAGAGIVIPPEDANALSDAVLKLSQLSPAELKKMGSDGLSYYKGNLSMDKGIDRFVEIFDSIAIPQAVGNAARLRNVLYKPDEDDAV